MKYSAPGPDGIPFWLYKQFSGQLSSIIAKLIIFSLSQCLAPALWRHAQITPVPKTNPVSGPSDFRPISVTSLLSRLTERIIVHDYVLPCLKPELFTDQYAYKPTGSTTCALIDFTYRIHNMLETNRYVRVVFLDLSKAFDMVDHPILINKLATLKISLFIIKWIVSFLSDRTQTTNFKFTQSSSASINRSVVQGSGLGPFCFLCLISDLKPLDIINILLKYADDCNLMCPENTPTSVEQEMQHILQWASTNKLLLNLIKTKEMIFHWPAPKLFVFPAELAGIERVNSFKLLGVTFHPQLQFSEHISTLITVCNQRLYLLTQLKKQGLRLSETYMVFKAIILSKIIYAIPVLLVYFTESHISQICAIFKKARQWQLTVEVIDFVALVEKLQYNLFQKSRSSTHCLNHLYQPSQNTSAMVLRNKGHNFNVPYVKFDFNTKHFIHRCLSKYQNNCAAASTCQ